ncbi:MAG: hypothetical protein AAB325_08890, partial [Pseudomonadota bacterium]
MNHPPLAQGLYDPLHERDACGVGFIAHIKGGKSHSIVEQGLTILKNLNHRGAVGADPKASDGAGILIQVPDRFFREELGKQDVRLPPVGQYGVGMVFLPRDPASRFACEYEIERAIKDEGQVLLGWRDVPVDNTDLGESVRLIEPVIRQVFVGRGAGVTVTDTLERKLYIIRKSAGHAIQALKLTHGKAFYVPSMFSPSGRSEPVLTSPTTTSRSPSPSKSITATPIGIPPTGTNSGSWNLPPSWPRRIATAEGYCIVSAMS